MVRRGKWSKGQDSGGKCLFQQMPEPVELYVDGHWKKNRGGAHWIEADPGKPWFSNGMAGLVRHLPIVSVPTTSPVLSRVWAPLQQHAIRLPG